MIERAFPVPNDANVNGQMGMTLRDYFAAKVICGMFADHTRDQGMESMAMWAYKTADAMLKERAK